MTESEILCECDAIEAMCGVAGAVGAPAGAFPFAKILEIVAMLRTLAAFVKDHPEIQAFVKMVIEFIKGQFGPQPAPAPDSGVV